MSYRSIAVRIQGIVQGVGFRPFVYRLAIRFSLHGTIVNTGTGVEIRVSGEPERISAFVAALQQEAPPLAVITSLTWEVLPEPVPGRSFEILESEGAGVATTLVSPDISVCDDCLAEIMDINDRRHGYPFTNCTNCGPRFTIISGLPYDRPRTSMAQFPMCSRCRREYDDPLDRRFHAQPNACPVCGPSLVLYDQTGKPFPEEDPIGRAAGELAQGKIVALKGLGGFHLCVDATDKEAVQRLRRRKHRYAKPLAVMVKDVAGAEKICLLSEQEKQLLLCRQRPIVLAAKKKGGLVSGAVAPGIRELGVMLPYTPLHYLLLAHPQAPEVLVMTSGNLSDEPICTGNEEALERLAEIADLFLLHDRDILTRVDDSVARISDGRQQMLRRSRGFAPMPFLLQESLPELLACGAELKSCFCLAREDRAFMSQHIGDLHGPRSMRFFEESVAHFLEVFEIKPEVVICDLHPDYLSSIFAGRYSSDHRLPLLQVQHHHAHAAAVMGEHGLDDVLAVTFDGAGLGADGTVWGGEFLQVNREGYQRLGHIDCFQLPGGDRASREVWRLAVSLLCESHKGRLPAKLPRVCSELPVDTLSLLVEMLEKGLNAPRTSSCGRLFDGVAALTGIRSHVRFEGQAAMELEGLAWQAVGEDPSSIPESVGRRYEVRVKSEQGLLRIDYRPMILLLLQDVEQGVDPATIAGGFHCWLAESTCALLDECRRISGLHRVVLSGGCMQNRLLLSMLFARLQERGFAVFTGEKIPVNDGGIGLGQALIGGRWYVSGNTHAGA